MKKWIALAVLAAVGAGAQAQAVCQQLEEAIRSAEKTMAFENATGLFDSSPARESARLARIANSWAAVHASLTVMEMNRCPAYGRPISELTYMGAALKCTASLRPAAGRAGPADLQTPECKRDAWARGGESSPPTQ